LDRVLNQSTIIQVLKIIFTAQTSKLSIKSASQYFQTQAQTVIIKEKLEVSKCEASNSFSSSQQIIYQVSQSNIFNSKPKQS
jgi:hypothetical protein